SARFYSNWIAERPAARSVRIENEQRGQETRSGHGQLALRVFSVSFPPLSGCMLAPAKKRTHVATAISACGYVLKSTPRKELVEAIRKVHSGKKAVPPDVAAQVAEHLSDQAL